MDAFRCFILVLIAALAGCASPLMLSLPRDVGTQGLVMARIYSPETADIGSAYPVIDGREYLGGANEGYIAVVLPPGRHTLQQLNLHVSDMNVPLATGGSLHLVDMREYPIGKEFDIAPGRVTNLGVMVISREPGVTGKGRISLRVGYVDNTGDMQSVLAAAHSHLYASLKDPSFLRAGGYLAAGELQKLRFDIAVNLLGSERWRSQHKDARLVTGELGTMAWIDPQSSGASLKLLDSPTARDLSACSVVKARAVCMLSSGEYLLADGPKVSLKQVPHGVVANSIHLIGDDQILLVDEWMVLHLSGDGGVTWRRDDTLRSREPIRSGFRQPDVLDLVRVARGRDGFYLYPVDRPAADARILYSRYGSAEFERIALPQGLEHIQSVAESSAGLHVVHHAHRFMDTVSTISVRVDGSGEWQTRNTADWQCGDLILMDQSGQRLGLGCKNGSTLQSDDGGVTWYSK